MPIIPSSWSGEKTVNATGLNSDSGFPIYKFAKTVKNIEITNLEAIIDLIGFVEEPINREVNLEVESGKVNLFWKNFDNSYQQINSKPLSVDTENIYKDTTLGQLGFAIQVIESSVFSIHIRWDREIDFYLYQNQNNDDPGTAVQLLSVFDDVFYINEALAASGNNDLITCTAYFPDNFIPPNVSWDNLYATNCDGIFQIFQWDGSLSSVGAWIYPTINNPYAFSFYPQQLISSHFELYYFDGEWGNTSLLKIVSFDPGTNTFIIDFN